MRLAMRRLERYLNSKRLSNFQKNVLLKVCEIPKGEVRSYKWVAGKVRRPGSLRAVGQALKKNPLPFVIPCHRVIKSNGKLGGFVFGQKMKTMLLSKEGLTVRKGVVIMNKRKG